MDNYDPPGFESFCQNTGKTLKIVTDGPYKGWVAYKGPDGQWVTGRKATKHEMERAIALMGGPEVGSK